MTVTCTFNDFKTLCGSYGGAMMFVKDASNDVTHASLFNTARPGIVFVLSNTPTKANFLAEFPESISVSSIV